MTDRINNNPTIVEDYDFICRYVRHCINLLDMGRSKEYLYYITFLCERKNNLKKGDEHELN